MLVNASWEKSDCAAKSGAMTEWHATRETGMGDDARLRGMCFSTPPWGCHPSKGLDLEEYGHGM